MLQSQLRAEEKPAVLNYEYLAGLERYLGQAHARELLSDGMIDLIGRLDRLGEVAGSGDSDAVAALSHEIVGAAGHLGLALLSHLAAQVSYAARSGDATGRDATDWDATDWIELLLESRSASIGQLREYCDTRLREVKEA